MSQATALNDGEFTREVVESTVPVLVYFWTAWCGPCKMMGPVVDGVADEYAGKVKVMKCDAGSNPITPSKFGVMSNPTLMLFKGGEVVGRIVGAVPKKAVDSLLAKALGR
jgi:thioredoxin 1